MIARIGVTDAAPRDAARLPPTDGRTRSIARGLRESIAGEPIICPHGHIAPEFAAGRPARGCAAAPPAALEPHPPQDPGFTARIVASADRLRGGRDDQDDAGRDARAKEDA